MAWTGIYLGAFSTFCPPLLFHHHNPHPARRAQCVNNLKQIALALHAYQQDFGRFPPAAVVDPAGRPLLSWRVLILPYMDRKDLYDEFRLDEPWDSPHNLKRLNADPYTYACPSHLLLKPGMTGYQAVVGPRTLFPSDFRPVALSEVTDGAEATVAVVEARRPVPWTKPDDLPFDAALAPDGLDRLHERFHAAFVDGSVRVLKPSLSPDVLRALLTRDGGETVSPDGNSHVRSAINEPPR